MSTLNAMDGEFPLHKLPKDMQNHVASFLDFRYKDESYEKFSERLNNEKEQKGPIVAVMANQIIKDVESDNDWAQRQKNNPNKPLLSRAENYTIWKPSEDLKDFTHIDQFSFSPDCSKLLVLLKKDQGKNNLLILHDFKAKKDNEILSFRNIENCKGIACCSYGKNIAYLYDRQLGDKKFVDVMVVDTESLQRILLKNKLTDGKSVYFDFTKSGSQIGLLKEDDSKLEFVMNSLPITAYQITLQAYFKQKNVCKQWQNEYKS
jgi:hypothetical protein